MRANNICTEVEDIYMKQTRKEQAEENPRCRGYIDEDGDFVSFDEPDDEDWP